MTIPTNTLMQFPCDFPLKIIGKNSESFSKEMIHIVTKHFPDVAADLFKVTLSENNNYASISVVIHVHNQATLDALYQELTQHPDTRMVL